MTDTTTTSKSPTHFVYHVRTRGEKSYWTRIGSAWPHADGGGFNLQLASLPVDGRLTLRVASAKND